MSITNNTIHSLVFCYSACIQRSDRQDSKAEKCVSRKQEMAAFVNTKNSLKQNRTFWAQDVIEVHLKLTKLTKKMF